MAVGIRDSQDARTVGVVALLCLFQSPFESKELAGQYSFLLAHLRCWEAGPISVVIVV